MTNKEYMKGRNTTFTPSQIAEIRQKSAKILKLSDLKGIAYKIAKVEIREHGFYTCITNGVRTFVQ